MKRVHGNLLIVLLVCFGFATGRAQDAPRSIVEKKVPVYELVAVKESKNPREFTDFAWQENGKQRWLSEFLKEGKVVLLNFWGTWCPPCRKELPDIVALSREHADKVEVVGVAIERGKNKMEKLKSFAAKAELPYRNVTTDNPKVLGQLVNAYGGIGAVPTTFIIRTDGQIVAKLVGAHNKSTFLQYVQKAHQAE